MTLCTACGAPPDSGVFDRSAVLPAPQLGEEVTLARVELHRNHCGLLQYFAQFTDQFEYDRAIVETPGLIWEIRINGQARDPYQGFDRVLNPWGLHGFPVNVQLEPGALVEFVVRRVAPDAVEGGLITRVGGRLIGRHWYSPSFGGVPNDL